ncbi:MAG TPA: response regulator transcription factor [Phycisphaerales bacterium]|nr:response regulator transcription factor [Phycisphaerales bacterium]HMP38005.1 response regulator transcription factor [Phycisphaerales bacterium]
MSRRPTILVVEDDRPIRRGIVDALAFGGFDAVEAGDGATALRGLEGMPIDLVLLDVMLPGGMDGFATLAEVRRRSATLPVIMLTARGGENDRVNGLVGGADDYVVKPFSARELLARIEAVLRRTPQRAGDAAGLRAGDLVICLRRREARLGEREPVPLSAREIAVLEHLARNPARTIHRDELLRVVWGLDPRGLATRTVDMQVARLREKLAPSEIVSTVRGAGYKLAADVEVLPS